MDVCDHLAVGTVESNLLTSVANLAANVTSDLLEVHLLCGDVSLAKKHDHACFSGGLHGDFGIRVDANAGIEHSIRDLIAELVGVTLTHRFRGKVD